MAGHAIPTGRINLGSLIGDHAKTAIGTLLPTGTVIGAGANLFGPSHAPKYVRPFAWGSSGEALLDEDGFLKIAGRVMPRRQVEFTEQGRWNRCAAPTGDCVRLQSSFQSRFRIHNNQELPNPQR